MLGMKIASRGARRIVAAVALALCAAAATAQTAHERTGAQRDWSVFAVGEGADRVCWIVSKPKKSEARRGGARATVTRGDIFLMVANRPAQNVRDEISLVVGYPLKPESTVRLDVGAESFAMFVKDETAWTQPADDSRVIASMKRGVEAVATGVSARGTTTIDTFSLLGFSAALDQSAAMCK